MEHLSAQVGTDKMNTQTYFDCDNCGVDTDEIYQHPSSNDDFLCIECFEKIEDKK